MSSETALSRWLQAEMPRRGYPLEGHRAGGISRLAEDTGIPQATMSRLVNGRTDPSIEQCRKIAHLFNLSLDEVLIRANLATPEEFHSHPRTDQDGKPRPPVSWPPSVSLPDLDPWEQHVWITPDLSVEEREAAILLVRVLRGDIEDDTPALMTLTQALHRALARRLVREQKRNPRSGQQHDPPQAS